MNTLPLKVDDRLYRGAKPGIKEIIHLKKLGVTQIVDLMRHEHKKEKWMCSLLGMKYVHVSSSILDKEFIRREHVATAVKAITENSGKSYVHCGGGTHRTGLVCAGYDMAVNKKSFQDVLNKDIFQPGYYSAKENPDLAKSSKQRAKTLNVFNMISEQLKVFIDEFAPKKGL